MIFPLLTVALLLLSFVIQEYIPGIAIAHHAGVLLPPLFFFVASVAMPYVVMLVLATITGLLWDCRHLPPMPLPSEEMSMRLAAESGPLIELAGTGHLPVGSSIIIFGLLGAMLQGVRPQFTKGRLGLPVIMIGVSTALWLAGEYLLHCLIRSNLPFPDGIVVKWLTDCLLAMLCAPALLLFVHGLAGLAQYEIRYDGLRDRSS